MCFSTIKLVKFIAQENNNSTVYSCKLISDIEYFDKKIYVFKNYNLSNKFNNEFNKTHEKNIQLIKLSMEIPGLCQIYGPVMNGNIKTIKDNMRQSCGILMEYIDGITLEKFIMNRKYDHKTIIDIIKQIILILKSCHDKMFMHRDIKPSNIMITKNNNIKILDFQYMMKGKYGIKTYGTPIYMAPEILKSMRYENNCDIYSFGAIIYKLIEKEELYDMAYYDDFNRDSYDNGLKNLREGYLKKLDKIFFDKFWNENPKIKYIFLKCIQTDPVERYTSEEIYNYLFDKRKLPFDLKKSINTYFEMK